MHIQIQPTPNPDSVKLTVDGHSFIDSGMESFSTPQEAEGHPLGSRIFALNGVANVFILPAFLTVTKHPAASWDALLPKIEHLLDEYFAGSE